MPITLFGSLSRAPAASIAAPYEVIYEEYVIDQQLKRGEAEYPCKAHSMGDKHAAGKSVPYCLPSQFSLGKVSKVPPLEQL